MPPSKKSRSSHRSSSSSGRSSSSRNDGRRNYNRYEEDDARPSGPVVKILQGILFVVAVVILLSNTFLKGKDANEKLLEKTRIISNEFNEKSLASGSQGLILNNKKEMFVSEIGRTCPWDSEFESYYDQTTDCYFWINTTISPPQWQYWYEDISSDFGDYGWMEYDYDESIWYIEVSEGEWSPLPDKYNTTELWHFATSS